MGVIIFYFPIVISFIFLLIQAIVSRNGNMWVSFTVAILYTLMAVFFFQSSNLLAFLLILSLTFWVMFIGAFTINPYIKFQTMEQKPKLVKLLISFDVVIYL